MLTRLRVKGFKNLLDVDLHFGPFTCIAGTNGVGKSNLFDAILFLSALADKPLIDAALSVRAASGVTSDPRNLFYRSGEHVVDRMSFEVEMIVPQSGTDDLGKLAHASITFLRYEIELAYRHQGPFGLGELELVHESLGHINLGEAVRHLPFSHSPTWRTSAVTGRRTSPFISTEKQTDGQSIVKRHQEGHSGRPLTFLARDLPRTVLSSATAAENPTALLAKREMQSWRLIQLEPSALREPDPFRAPMSLGSDGSHLPSTLFNMAHGSRETNGGDPVDADATFAHVANRLSELIDDVRDVSIDRDEQRQLLTLIVKDRAGTLHPARSLSDGTLRFLALAVLDLESAAHGLICMEEPENGIHPDRIPAMLQLLEDIAVDAGSPIGPDNPLRQVMVNTHSPSVVSQVQDDSLLAAEPAEEVVGGRRLTCVHFSSLPGTWREKIQPPPSTISKGSLISYLNPINPRIRTDHWDATLALGKLIRSRRVIDRPDLQLLLPLSDEQSAR